jgi:membrane-bound lytic murein transglycosylase D
MRSQRAVLVMLLSLSAGCGVEGVRKSQPIGELLGADVVGPVASVDEYDGPSIGRSVGRGKLAPGATHEFDAITLHPRVVSEAKEMTRGRGVTVRDALTRSGRYIDIIARELQKEGVPPELAYLPAIESHFSHQAEGAGTVGLWQFTSGTARRYGLMVTSQVDERRDPELASRAAARLLRDLYDQFGRWGLVLAAYNAGPARVQQALDRNPGADFWQLLDRGSLPAHTKEYVPKVLAVAAIANEPARFGLDGIEPLQPLSYETFSVAEPMDVKTIASMSGCSSSSISELNPALRRGVVPKGGFEIRLPDGSKKRFESNYRARKYTLQ